MQTLSPNIYSRNFILDIYRGIAVLLMMIFHFCWDLREFGFIDYKLSDPFWVTFRSIILFLFLTAIGWAAYLSHKKPISSTHKTRQFLLRQRKLLAAAALISFATYTAFPYQWIYFGILHFILIVSFIHYPFASYPLISATIGLLIGIIYYSTDWLLFPNIYHFIINLGAPQNTLDIIYPFPWVACVFLGSILGQLSNQLEQSFHSHTLKPLLITHFFTWLGQNALSIYLLHQIILYGLVSLTAYLLVSFF